MIFPADSPRTAVVSGYGVCLRLENSSEKADLTINLIGDFADETKREIFSPDGVCVRLIDEKTTVEIPESVPEFVVSRLTGEDAWSVGRAGMLYRDLIPSRLNGRFIVSHIRIETGGEVPDYVHFHRIRFQMIYCLSGWARLIYENQGEAFLMNAGDCVLQPPEIRHRVLECSDGFEVLEIGCPAVHETRADFDLSLPNDVFAPEKLFGGQRFVHFVAEKAVWKSAEIEGFEFSDVGIADATDGLADVGVFRAVANKKFAVKHAGEFLFFFILRGKLNLSDGAGENYLLKPKDCFVLPTEKEYSIEAETGAEFLRIYL
jgi:quercetin dioxygenase-like cupin family protein